MYRLKRNVISSAFPLFCIAATVYFIYYALNGEFGYGSLVAHRLAIHESERAIGELKAHNLELEAKVSLLASDAIDPDYLEERARVLLGYAREGDIIVARDEFAPDKPE